MTAVKTGSPIRLSKRVCSIPQSPMRRLEILAAQIQAEEGVDILRVNTGDPDLEVPIEFFDELAKIAEAGKAHKEARHLPYPPSMGRSDYIAAWIDYYRGYGVNLDPWNIVPMYGAGEGIFASLAIVTDAGDEVIVPEPVYAPYIAYGKFWGLILCLLPCVAMEPTFTLPQPGK